MTEAPVTDADLDELIELVAEATWAFMREDMRRCLALNNHTTNTGSWGRPEGTPPTDSRSRTTA